MSQERTLTSKEIVPPDTPVPIRYLHGIGPRRAEALEKLGVRSLGGLFYFFPRRYEDRTHFMKIGEVVASDNVTLRGEVLTLGIRPVKQKPIFEMRSTHGVSQ